MRHFILAGTLAVASAICLPAMGEVLVLIDDDFESGLGGWTQVLESHPTPSVFDDTPSLFPADGTGMYGPNTPYSGQTLSQSAGFAGDLPEPDTTTVTWLQRQFPTAVPPGSKVILTLELDRYVYDSTAVDTYQYCNRFYIMTNELYDDPMWGCHGVEDGEDPINLNNGGGNGSGARSSVWNHETGSGSNTGGAWRHTSWTDATNKVFTSQNGSIEIRLVNYERPDVSGQLTMAWDNLHVVLKDFTTKAVLWELHEDFESYSSVEELTAVWSVVGRPSEDPNRPDNDTAVIFETDDTRLYTNSSNPGSRSAGYSSDLLYLDFTEHQWLQKQLPGALAPGTYPIELEYDRYVYKGPGFTTDPFALGNKVYLLTNELYNDPTYAVDSDPDPFETGDGFRSTLWNGDSGGSYNGVWNHHKITGELTTETGDLEVRLLMQDKYVGPSAVAFDNVKLTVFLPCNNPRFDFDGDLDVDQEDYGLFQACYSGIVEADVNCRCMNSDGDIDIDQTDITAFEACALTSGPSIPAAQDCDDALPPP